MVLRKLGFYKVGGSDKHIRDIAGILELSSDDLNTERLLERISSYGLTGECEKAKKTGDQ